MSNHQGNHKKRLIGYCLYAWGTPALVVSICVIIDQFIKRGYFGYGKCALQVLFIIRLSVGSHVCPAVRVLLSKRSRQLQSGLVLEKTKIFRDYLTMVK